MLVTQYVFITRWTCLDFPPDWCHPLGMCLLSLEIMTRSLLECQQWKCREFHLSSILYLLQFSETVLKIKQVCNSQQGSSEIFFTVSRDTKLTFGNFSMYALYGSSMTHVHVIESHSSKITVAFWKCSHQTWRDAKFWFKFKGQLVNIVILLDPMAIFYENWVSSLQFQRRKKQKLNIH